MVSSIERNAKSGAALLDIMRLDKNLPELAVGILMPSTARAIILSVLEQCASPAQRTQGIYELRSLRVTPKPGFPDADILPRSRWGEPSAALTVT